MTFTKYAVVRWSLSLFALSLLGSASGLSASADDRVDYNRDIRPLLSNNCYQCHGPDEKSREAGLRFDLEDSAKGELESGGVAISPGMAHASKLIARIISTDESEMMPPPDSGKELKPAEIALLKKWVEQGADWGVHWAFVKPERPAPPKLKQATSPIDAFIIAAAIESGLQPNPAADKESLIRRVTLDLTGLPPTLEEIDAFVADESPRAYEKVVDRLLKSPRYGEHRARYWLDAARYGDTHGLHLDNERSIWPYRDWVIDAFNSNKPFDQFTIEQLAGDLLPNATEEQRIATGFNRCNVSTSEGGSIAEEYRVRYAVDRVETTATVWMGLTAGCAVCHDHKFDPLTQREFYQLFAYFGNTADAAMDGNKLLPPPVMKIPSQEQSKKEAELTAQIAATQAEIAKAIAAVEYTDPHAEAESPSTEPQDYIWFDDALPPGAKPQGNEAAKSWKFVPAAEFAPASGENSHTRTAAGLSQHFFTGANPTLKIGKNDKFFAYVFLDPKNPPEEVMLQFNNGAWEHRAYWGSNKIDWGADNSPARFRAGDLPELGKWVRLEIDAAKVGLPAGSAVNGWAFTQFGGAVHWDQAGLVTATEQGNKQYDSLAKWTLAQAAIDKPKLPAPVIAVLKVAPDKRNDAQNKTLRDYFLEHVYSGARSVFAPLHKRLADAESQLKKVQAATPSTMVMADAGDRDTFILIRGEYDKHGDKVTAGTPAVLPPLPNDAPPTRLALAQWLVSPEHPLTSRVTVNRFWQQLFGVGLVRTAEDFGVQGEWPSHPELLDWLAIEFQESGWDVKALIKQMVMSSTYRQSVKVTPQQLEIDPENRLLSRGPRFRMDAEMIRDTALYVSGLLVESVGGKSVKPYQPGGLWKAVGYTNSNTANFSQDHGAALYRRGLYTFWKRTAPPPSLIIFDAPSREACTVRRARTNTPLQALVLMNDIQYVEAARRLAERVMQHGGDTPEQRITYAVRLATGRAPDPARLKIYLALYTDYLVSYQQEEEAAKKLLAVGESPRDESLPLAEQAAYTMIANVVLNLSEMVNK